MPSWPATFFSSGRSIAESSPAAFAGRVNVVVSLISVIEFHFLLCEIYFDVTYLDPPRPNLKSLRKIQDKNYLFSDF